MSGAASSAVRRPSATIRRTVSSASVMGHLPGRSGYRPPAAGALVEGGQSLAGGRHVDLAGLERTQDLEAGPLQRVGR